MIVFKYITHPIEASMNQHIEYNVVEFSEEAKSAFRKSLEASFIGSEKEPDDRFAPRILSNNDSTSNVLSVIKGEFLDCVSFDLSVAFITASGIQVLAEILSQLRQRGIKGRILTSTYLCFNDPDALRKLLEYSNIETRVYQGDLHAKGYFFNKKGISTIIIGSSNLTQTALTCNKEWNVLFRSFPTGDIAHKTKAEFEKLWTDENTANLDMHWIESYEKFLAEKPTSNAPARRKFYIADMSEGSSPSGDDRATKIKPNKMQTHALEALDVLHQRNDPRALLVSATGTGKTYLSALDVAACAPKRVLFIAHRQRILDASMKSFRRVLGDGYSYGQFANQGERDATCLFAMVISLSTKLDEFSPDDFDYIIIDEAHRTGANSYQKILDYFKPKFVLGMTATPSRTDGYDVYALFNHVIAYRITLQDALENDMLVPFHYFGIADLEIDEEQADDFALFSRLTAEERVDHIIRKIEEYSVCKENRRGLIFCSRNDEAQALSRLFNERAYRTLAISGESSDNERDTAIAQLENGELQYIFSVDIFNEGVDIPSLNQIIMLRKTESAIVFVQQLGRGLRKDPSKDFTLVLDFIGNYQQNYLIPIALAGDRTYNKDNLRKVVKEGSSIIPGCSTITFDHISEQRVFKALEEGRFGTAKLIRSEYGDLRRLLGRIPSLLDFDANESIDPMIIINKYGSYPAFLQQYEQDCPYSLSPKKLDYLKFVSTKMASGKRRGELLILQELLKSSDGSVDIASAACRSNESTASTIRMLSGEFSTRGEQLIREVDGKIVLDSHFETALSDPWFRSCVSDVIEFGLSRNEAAFAETYKDTDFVLNQKYTREDVCRLLRWAKEPNYQNVGGYFHDKETNTFPVFINYEKDPDISVTTQYEDRFVSDREIICISKSNRTLQSPEIGNLAHARELGMRCFLFLRKNKKDKDDGTEFYFLGEMHPTGHFEQIVMEDGSTSAVEITYDLETPVRADLYDYFLSSFDK